ncbi:MAG: hypothetical protein Q4F49_04980 [Pseudoxanthomonas suwonensis]|nr:hypothetical protein [Pseudoxanthomonas suwonensis]
MNRLPHCTDNDDAFDARARACYRQALAAVPPQVAFRLRPQPTRRPVTTGRSWQLGAALAGTVAAVLAVGLGLGLRDPAPSTTPLADAPAVTAAAATGGAPPATVLDEDPDFFAWLGSAEARQLAMER